MTVIETLENALKSIQSQGYVGGDFHDGLAGGAIYLSGRVTGYVGGDIHDGLAAAITHLKHRHPDVAAEEIPNEYWGGW